MLEQLFTAIVSLGSSGAQNLLISAGESVGKKFKESYTWKKLLVDTGEFFIKNEQDEKLFFDDLELVLSKENLSEIAKDLKTEDGYVLKQKLYKSLMQLMRKYEIPYEIAEDYTMKIIYVVLEQLKTIDPKKYEHYFLQEWRDEQEHSFLELQKRIEKMSKELAICNREQVAIASSGQMDIELRRSTQNPSIGIEFFIVDDENFQDEFEELRYEDLVYIRGRNREETIYCILNELWRLNDKRPIYVVKSLESWNKLQTMRNEGNIYIPWFYADEIIAIENNTNIFVLDENTPAFNKSVLELRPRTYATLSRCLEEAGMKYDKAYDLLADTHGLFIQMKKKLFRGEYLKQPSWISGVSENAKKTCLLIGSWEEIEGDKLIIESVYGDSYDRFLGEVLPYTIGEDPLLYMTKRNGIISYYLASVENVWSYLNVLTNERIWEIFVAAVLEVINESETLFTYDGRERLLAHFKGERLFWSETIRKGMLKTLLIKAAYQKDQETQIALNRLVEKILECVKTEKQWSYIARFWGELCEISPVATLERLEKELSEDTGLLSLFRNQSSDFIFGRNAYIDILWGIEQFLVQKEYFWQGFRWLLKLDSYRFEYKSNSPKDIFTKIFCTWVNFCAIEKAEEKLIAAEMAFESNYENTWEYLYAAIDNKGRSIFGGISSPKYREHEITRSTTVAEMQKAHLGYFNLLIKHMDFSVEHWEKMVDLSDDLPDDLREEVFEQLLYEINQMSDEEVMQIKNEIRHLIYRHRYFASSEWAMSEEIIVEYENLLKCININTPEYEYVYLFKNGWDHPLLHPVPHDEEGQRNDNEIATHALIRKSLAEFQKCGYRLVVLAKICGQETYSTLGNYLAKYWNDGKWEFETFKKLISVQESGAIAMDYLGSFASSELLPYRLIIEELLKDGVSIEILSNIYRIEAVRTQDMPLVTYASEQVKTAFWRNSIICEEQNISWVLMECKKYASLDVYLDQVYRIHYRNPLSAEQILICFDEIESMPHSDSNQMTKYHVEQLMEVIQDAYMDDAEKSVRIAHLEMLFMNLLEWKNMRCFHRMIKQSPELFAQLVASIFKKDHDDIEKVSKNQAYFQNMYTIYDKAHFCPAENNGQILKEELEEWIEKYRQLLIDSDQESLFTTTLGRLFSFSPVGTDGHEPCEAVRKAIEKYGDDKMISRYRTAVYNRRGVFSPSAGKEELRMAEEFKANAQYLEPRYPMTAKIFYGLYETYKRESDRERMDAENGWY